MVLSFFLVHVYAGIFAAVASSKVCCITWKKAEKRLVFSVCLVALVNIQLPFDAGSSSAYPVSGYVWQDLHFSRHSVCPSRLIVG